MSLHVIVGAGAVGSGTALRLAEAGHDVRIITRSGAGPEHAGVERVAADAAERSRLTELSRGAHSLYNCANPPYNKWASDWPPLAASFLGAAEATGARLVTMSNLYGFARGSSPMRATDPLVPFTRKGTLRTDMWADALAAHEQERIQATEARASDYFGPGLGETSHLGDRAIPRVLAGKSVSLLGPADVEHSWSYIDDVCATLATLGTDDRSLGRAWHVPTLPAVTARTMLDEISTAVGGSPVKVNKIPRPALRLAGLVSPVIRELWEVCYQFDEPFVIDATDTTEIFALDATPLEEQIRATVAAYQSPAMAQ